MFVGYFDVNGGLSQMSQVSDKFFVEKEWMRLLKNDKGRASVADMHSSNYLKCRTKTVFLGWVFPCKKENITWLTVSTYLLFD